MKYVLTTATLFLFLELPAQVNDFKGVSFQKADSVAAFYQGYPLDNLIDLSHKLTESLGSDVEKFRAILVWVAKNIENDFSLFMRNKRKRIKYADNPGKLEEWNSKFNPRVFNELVNHYRTMCTGYSYLVSELSYFAGLECHIVDGYAKTARSNNGGKGFINHSWNAVKLNNKWYLCDPTWASGKIIPGKGFVKDFRETYFLTEPRLFNKNHYPDVPIWLLDDSELTLSEFLSSPLIYQGGIDMITLPVFPDTYAVNVKKGSATRFIFKMQNTDSIQVYIKSAGNLKSIDPTLGRIGADLVYIYHTFEHRGTFDVHFTNSNTFLFSYQVIVD